MAIFVIAPLILVVIFAFTDKDGGVTLDNFSNMGTYFPAFRHSFVLAIAATADLHPHRLSPGLFPVPGER